MRRNYDDRDQAGQSRGGRGNRGDRGNRGGYGNRDDRSGYGNRGDRGGYGNRGDRGGYGNRGDKGGYGNRGDRGGYGTRGDRGGHTSRPKVNFDMNKIVGTMRNAAEMENEIIPTCGEMYGLSGNQCEIVSNYFKMVCLPTTTYCQYRVDFEPEVPNIRHKTALLHEHEDILGSTFTFDGALLFMPKKLPHDKTTLNAIIIHKPRSNENAPSESVESSKTECKITISLVSVIPFNSPMVLNVLNLMFQRFLKNLGYKRIKRHFYDPNRKIEFSDYGLEVWPGFQTAFASIGKDILLCCDVSYHVVMNETIHDVLTDMYSRYGNDLVNKAKEELIGKVIMTRYNNASYKISDINFATNPNSLFQMKDGSNISYKEYMRTRYNIHIKDDKQPMIISIPKKKREEKKKGEKDVKALREVEEKPIFLIPELCCMTGMSDSLRSNFQFTRRMADQTRLDPTERAVELVKLMESIDQNKESNESMKNWGWSLERNLMSIPGRTFNKEEIIFGNNQKVENINGDWTRGLRDATLVQPATLQNWILVYSNRSKAEATGMISELIKISSKMGFRVSNPRCVEAIGGNVNNMKDAIKRNVKSNDQMVVAILDSPRKEVYDAIKKLCCCEIGIASQIVLQKTLKKSGLASILTKVGIQMNVKLGGEAWYVPIPIKKTMIIGIDVCHDPQSKKNSYGGMVASMNDRFTRYYSTISMQHSQGEIVNSLGAQLQTSLIEFRKMNNCYPEKIIMFRDGVGDGQFDTVKTFEVKQMQDILKSVAGETPKLSVIIVKKRINSRLLSISKDGLSNPPPGTVVDKFLSKGAYPNYYVISQYVRQGTVNPTNYVILHNETSLKTDHLQRLTYKLTHIYYNWSGNVRVPAPCQYAHKLCFIGSNSIRSDVKKSLCHHLFFL